MKLVKKRGLAGLSGFVNGVLRNIARNKESIKLPDEIKEPVKYLAVKYSMPEEIVEHFIEEYGGTKAEKILETFERKQPIIARVNRLRLSREELIKQLKCVMFTGGRTPERQLYLQGSGEKIPRD